MNKTVAQISQEALRIEAIVRTLQPGEFIEYSKLEELTGVKMDTKGKQYLRTAFNRLKMEYTPVIGSGIEIAGPTNATQIIAKRVIKIDRSVRKAERTVKRISDSHYDQLSEPDKKHVNFVGALLSAVRTYSQNAKAFFKKDTPRAIN